MVGALKPDPEIFIKAAAALDLPPESCLAVEDSYVGINSARAAGCAVVMIPDLLPPDREIQDKVMDVLPNIINITVFF